MVGASLQACRGKGSGGGSVVQLSEELAVVVAETGVGQKIGAVGEGLGERGLATPATDGQVVAAGENLGHGDAAELGRASVVGIVEKTARAVSGAGNAVGG